MKTSHLLPSMIYVPYQKHPHSMLGPMLSDHLPLAHLLGFEGAKTSPRPYFPCVQIHCSGTRLRRKSKGQNLQQQGFSEESGAPHTGNEDSTARKHMPKDVHQATCYVQPWGFSSKSRDCHWDQGPLTVLLGWRKKVSPGMTSNRVRDNTQGGDGGNQ